jgi:hypothetical protein
MFGRLYFPSMSDREHKKVSNGLVALSAAAVLAVYTAGYVRTRSAADRVALQAEGRRPPIAPPSVASAPPVESAPVRTPDIPSSAAARPEPPEPPAPTRAGGFVAAIRPAAGPSGGA